MLGIIQEELADGVGVCSGLQWHKQKWTFRQIRQAPDSDKFLTALFLEGINEAGQFTTHLRHFFGRRPGEGERRVYIYATDVDDYQSDCLLVEKRCNHTRQFRGAGRGALRGGNDAEKD